MDYDKMTTESLSNWAFEKSGFRINQQDLKSRIENLCVKYAKGEFDISGYKRPITTTREEIELVLMKFYVWQRNNCNEVEELEDIKELAHKFIEERIENGNG